MALPTIEPLLQTQPCYINSLPEEALFNILTFVTDPEDRKCVQLTCKTFNRIFKDGTIQKYLDGNQCLARLENEEFYSVKKELARLVRDPKTPETTFSESITRFYKCFRKYVPVVLKHADLIYRSSTLNALTKVSGVDPVCKERLTRVAKEFTNQMITDICKEATKKCGIRIFNLINFISQVNSLKKTYPQIKEIEGHLLNSSLMYFEEAHFDYLINEHLIDFKEYLRKGESVIKLKQIYLELIPLLKSEVDILNNDEGQFSKECTFLSYLIVIAAIDKFYEAVTKSTHENKDSLQSFFKKEVQAQLQEFGSYLARSFNPSLLSDRGDPQIVDLFESNLLVLCRLTKIEKVSLSRVFTQKIYQKHKIQIDDLHGFVESELKQDPTLFRHAVALKLRAERNVELVQRNALYESKFNSFCMDSKGKADVQKLNDTLTTKKELKACYQAASTALGCTIDDNTEPLSFPQNQWTVEIPNKRIALWKAQYQLSKFNTRFYSFAEEFNLILKTREFLKTASDQEFANAEKDVLDKRCAEKLKLLQDTLQLLNTLRATNPQQMAVDNHH